MKKTILFRADKSLTAVTLLWAIFMMPFVTFAQTRIVAPKNRYKVSDDVKLGQDAARQVEQQMPLLNDYQSQQYLQQVGERLANAIPTEYQHPEFRYSFKIVNARDINAFALPGGPMFVNRGMIEAAQNEGEMAGVMAHELSHVALRHATAQATKQSNPLNQILGIGSILGGAIVGGQAGAALGQTLYSGLFVYPNSREYETQADTLGAQILARAGYDPRDLANMFKTIERTSGGGGPEFLSTHPNPENRYNNISREASLLRVSPEPIKLTQGFQRTKRYLQSLPQAPTSEQIAQGGYGSGSGNGNGNTTASGNYSTRVAYPSSQTRSINLGIASVNAPSNWEVINQSNTEISLAPQGAYGNQGITHGSIVGITQGGNGNLQQATDAYVQGILQSNNYLRAQSNYSRTVVGGRNGLMISLSGTSPINNRTEVDTIYTTQLANGSLFYVVAVAPQNEAPNYNYAFRNMIRSIQFTDR